VIDLEEQIRCNNIVILHRYSHKSVLKFYPDWPFSMRAKNPIALKRIYVERHCPLPRVVFQLTDEDVECMILPRII